MSHPWFPYGHQLKTGAARDWIAGFITIALFKRTPGAYILVDMRKQNSSSLSRGGSSKEIGEFWDVHDLADYWNETEEAEFAVEIESETTCYALGKALSEQVRALAHKEGISADTLLNLWVQEKLRRVSGQGAKGSKAQPSGERNIEK